ncbi:MAG: hypothetical protein CM1200mP14_21980 [Gammaproteobacteria bacterium]|nr:MAG: hypothetical protein CM1200mP14_21980 [Gammaproteobacteria bacterium]
MTLVIFECEAKEGCMDELKSTLKGLLPDTRPGQAATRLRVSLIQMERLYCLSLNGNLRSPSSISGLESESWSWFTSLEDLAR